MSCMAASYIRFLLATVSSLVVVALRLRLLGGCSQLHVFGLMCSFLPPDDNAGDLSLMSRVDLAVVGSMLASATKLIL